MSSYVDHVLADMRAHRDSLTAKIKTEQIELDDLTAAIERLERPTIDGTLTQCPSDTFLDTSVFTMEHLRTMERMYKPQSKNETQEMAIDYVPDWLSDAQHSLDIIDNPYVYLSKAVSRAMQEFRCLRRPDAVIPLLRDETDVSNYAHRKSIGALLRYYQPYQSVDIWKSTHSRFLYTTLASAVRLTGTSPLPHEWCIKTLMVLRRGFGMRICTPDIELLSLNNAVRIGADGWYSTPLRRRAVPVVIPHVDEDEQPSLTAKHVLPSEVKHTRQSPRSKRSKRTQDGRMSFGDAPPEQTAIYNMLATGLRKRFHGQHSSDWISATTIYRLVGIPKAEQQTVNKYLRKTDFTGNYLFDWAPSSKRANRYVYQPLARLFEDYGKMK